MPKTNKNLNEGRKTKNDEFYTVTTEATKEIIPFYSAKLNGKKVLCNCNDGIHKGIVDCLKENYNALNLAQLVYTEYGEWEENGKIYIYDGEEENVINLPYKGDFRYGLSLKYLQLCDVVITGPPYSLFSDFIELLFEYYKKFIVICDINLLTLKRVFPYFRDKRMWLGVTKPTEFIVPNEYTKECWIGEDGLKRVKRNRDVWLTNLEYDFEKPYLNLTASFSEKKYLKCDNFDAIWVNTVKEIPMDYEGTMCVPISFVEQLNHDQFNVLGLTDEDKAVKQYRIEGHDKFDRIYYLGERKYPRLLIKRKK